MRQPDLPADGGCRCGAVRFRITQAPLITGVCHCRGCQRMTGGAYSATVTIPEGGFAVSTGETRRGGTREGWHQHEHCPDCMSWVFTRFDVAEMPFVNVRATMLDDASWFAPFIETQTAEALPWALVAAPHSFPRFPEEADYPALMATYAEAASAA